MDKFYTVENLTVTPVYRHWQKVGKNHATEEAAYAALDLYRPRSMTDLRVVRHEVIVRD